MKTTLLFIFFMYFSWTNLLLASSTENNQSELEVENHDDESSHKHNDDHEDDEDNHDESSKDHGDYDDDSESSHEEDHADHDGHSDEHGDDEDSHDESSKDHGDHDDDSESSHEEDHADHDGHNDDHGDDHGEESNNVTLSKLQQQASGIETEIVVQRYLSDSISAPGEVVLNEYSSTSITSRIPAQVIKRHVRIGEIVEQGQALITLSSVDMAEAQSQLFQASIEWNRVQKLGRNVVSDKRYTDAEIEFRKGISKVRAYGMLDTQVEAFLQENKPENATGQFTLLALQSGTVINDDFIIGGFVDPGQVLLEISDESVLWVEARLAPDIAASIQIGSPAHIKIKENYIQGKVVSSHHKLDETTRTRAVTIEAPNENDRLHPGEFVIATLEGPTGSQGIVVPKSAVLRGQDGDWLVFVEATEGVFEPKEVNITRTVADLVMVEGIDVGTTIVTEGAFFVQSEIAKSGFSVHNH